MLHDQFDSFQKADKKTWTETARKELDGKDPFENLSRMRGNLSIHPYYDHTDTALIRSESLKPSSDPYLGPRAWRNTPLVTVNDGLEANTIALDHLRNGADGILFSIKTPVDIDKLLAGIELSYCGTYFLFEDDHSNLLVDFEQYAIAKKIDTTQIVGAAFWKKLPSDKIRLITLFKDWDKFHVLGITSTNESDSSLAIAAALANGARTLSETIDNGVNKNIVIPQLCFSFNIGQDFFIEIAKLKAFRRLWRQVIRAYGVTHSDSSTLIHGFVDAWRKKDYEPNANMLKGTTAAMSAVLGGCDGITVEPDDANDEPFKARIARNVLSVLREESHLNLTADPTAGSYYLESLTDQLAKAAWSKFQHDMKS